MGGACIDYFKVFLRRKFCHFQPDGFRKLGFRLVVPYTNVDTGMMTVSGELNKIAHNITFGHGLHGGIHWRTDSDQSMVLGEAMAISFLQDKAQLIMKSSR